MHNPKSPKSQKLLQFHSKLAKLTNPPVTHSHPQQCQKLQQLVAHSKSVQTQISGFFDQKSEYYLKSQVKIVSIGRGMVEVVDNWERGMLDMLAHKKEKELELILGEVNGFLGWDRRVRQCLKEIEGRKGHVMEGLLEDIDKMKKYNTKPLNQKIQQITTNRQQIDQTVLHFSKMQETIQKNYQTFLTSPDKQKPQQQQKQGTLQKYTSNHNTINKAPKNTKIKQEKGQLSDEESIDIDIQERLQSKFKKIFSGTWNKTEEKEENLMEQSRNLKNSRKQKERDREAVSRNLQFQDLHSEQQYSEQQEQQIIIPMAPNPKPPKLQRQQSQPTISHKNPAPSPINPQKNINNFLLQLKRTYNEQPNQDISSRDNEISILPAQAKFAKLSRVRSQENIAINFKMKNSRPQYTPEIYNEEGMASVQNQKNYENIKSITSMKLNKNTMKESTMKSGRTGKGDWAAILKDQQAKYNQMRRKIKD